MAALGGTPGGTSGWALYTWGGIGAAFGAGVDGTSDTAMGGTFPAAAGVFGCSAGGTFASAAGRALTFGPVGTWALGGGSLTSGADGFFASPAAPAQAFVHIVSCLASLPGPGADFARLLTAASPRGVP